MGGSSFVHPFPDCLCCEYQGMGKDGNFLVDFALGGVSGAVAKTITAPIERIKLVVQTQDANPKIRSGEVPRYTGIVDCGSRILKEQGMKRFWDGNFTNCIRYFPTQAFNLAFKDTFKAMFPKYNPKTQFAQFFGANLVSGGLAAASSLCIVYPLDYARTRLASDVGSGKKSFSGLGDCIVKTMKGPGGFLALYTGFGVSVVGIVGYRGLRLGCFDTITGLNPYKTDKGILGAASTFAAAQQKRVWQLASTRVSWPTFFVVSAVPWYWSSTIAPRTPWGSEVHLSRLLVVATFAEGQGLRAGTLPEFL